MNGLTTYLEKFGSNFMVSAMVPSLSLVVVSTLFFDPTLSIIRPLQNLQGISLLISLGLIVFILTSIIGFTLTALNTYILKIFEGYIVFPPLKFLYKRGRRIHRQKARELMARRESLEKEYLHLKKLAKSNPELTKRMEEVINEHFIVASDYDQNYPGNLEDVLPTKFGNTLRAAEDHAVQRYGFDGVTFWPRLVHVIPDGYRSTIDNTRNELSFLVNMSILSILFSCLCILAIFLTLGSTNVLSLDPAIFWGVAKSALKYLFAAAAGALICGFFYNASIISLGSFTLTIRSSFDLFRRDLLKKLEIVRPNNFDEEFDTWSNLNELIMLGNQSLTFQKFAFREEEEEAK
jgi:hypothetical protein